MMGTAFLGYVLPFGQMSIWGATVITNLLSASSEERYLDFIETYPNLLQRIPLKLGFKNCNWFVHRVR